MRDHPRQEPGAVIPPAGIRAGGGGQPPSLPRPPAATGSLLRRSILRPTRLANQLHKPAGADVRRQQLLAIAMNGHEHLLFFRSDRQDRNAAVDEL